MAGKEPSGVIWVGRFPDAKNRSALENGFRQGCEEFIAAMKVGGIGVTVNSTRRPEEGAYLMHYSWRIHIKTMNPGKVPAKTGVDIDWVPKGPNGKMDLVASRHAATEMVTAYGIKFQPALKSKHISGEVVDISIPWAGTATIKNKTNKNVKIAGTPRDGFNLASRKVGHSYGVVKHPLGAPHGSTNRQ